MTNSNQTNDTTAAGRSESDLDADSAREALLAERAAHAETQRKLDATLEALTTKTTECEEMAARFETALRGAQVHVFAQDRDLRYTWISSPGDGATQSMLGHTDDEIWSSPEQEALIAIKREVLATGKPADCEVSTITPERRALFALHINPVFAADQSVEGIICAAIDISRIRSLESEQRRLSEELGTSAQRYEVALRGSNIAVFTQDTDLRYTSLSKTLFGEPPERILGCTDQDLLPSDAAQAAVALKRDALNLGEPRNAELRVERGGNAFWYDLHIEPMRDVSGNLIGVTGAAIDITERKEGEAHLRLLMRELTHRSKNLLAVIVAMARQTARHSGNIQAFLERFSARVQALARSHDLLVAESWHGASLHDLVRSQLSQYIDREPDRFSIEGPDIQLRPEAAQSIGLALHELATNAAKHGAMSKASGHVAITWEPERADGGIVLVWRESGGPKVSQPKRRGFGSTVIEHNLARALDADVDLDFAAEGLTCRVVVPQAQIAPRPQ